MDPADLSGLPVLLELLTEATLAGSAALLLVLVVRRPLRHAFGAGVAYAAWALVPAAMLAVALPAATVTEAAAPVAILLNTAVAPLPTAAPFDSVPLLLAAWLAGAVIMALRLGRQQRAFRRGLGCLRLRADGLQQAESVAGLPAAVGLLRPAIVVPADFDARYSGEERALMHAHERSHIARGDLQLNALVALMRSVLWFNPLLHYASRHFRHDQELACDQRVIARHPHGRRAYGEAMVKTQLASQPLPMGCHWAVFDHARNHPLKERIAMLKQPTPSAARWIGGGFVVVTLLLGASIAAWAAQPHRVVSGAPGTVAPPEPPPPPKAPPAPPSVRTGMPAIAPPAPPAPPVPASPAVPPLPAPPAPPESSTGSVNRMTAPAYPADALAKRLSGKVVLAIDIDAQGTPIAVEVERSEPVGVFDQAAVDAAMKWTFTPEVRNGKPVPGRVRVPIEFKAPSATQAAPGTSAEV